MIDFLAQLAQIIGIQYVLTDHEDIAPYLTDWRKRYTGKALAVVLPRATLEIAQIVDLCSSKGVSIVPQGGHTGFCGGATPMQVAIKLSSISSA
jgi:FAD/FMN-containing dehydrogenase